ncbi:MAG: phosphoglucomutase/phosphomannomutase family protein [Chloroflexi bacterium]|nr:phosphoglucomutase/phosphomannomutase family protein [Chloroflexota bacterium]
MPTEIKFGTDGWRGVIADDYTYENLRRCAHGMAQYLIATKQTTRGLVIGYDTRFSAELFAQVVAEVIAAHGIKVFMVDRPTPTPVISYAILAQRAHGAVNLTSSHNPPMWGGFKVRADYAGAIGPEGLKQIESFIPAPENVKRMPFKDAQAQGLIEIFDPKPAFRKQLDKLVNIEPLRQAGLTLAVDSMWGAGMGWFKELLAGGATRVVEIHNYRNPSFPEMNNPEPIPPNVNGLMELVKREHAHLGIATDGDADRIGGSTEQGVFIHQLQMYALLALYLLEVRGMRGAIVKTLNTTSMLDKLGKRFNVPVHETGVGFKFVAPKILETNAMIGGEESGGYAFRDHIPERDGIVAALYLMDFVVQTGKTPSQLLDHLFELVGPHYYERIDTEFPGEQRGEIMARLHDAQPSTIAGFKVTEINLMDGFKYLLDDGGWLCIRFSGTEPIMRFYVETTQDRKRQEILDAGLKLAGLR